MYASTAAAVGVARHLTLLDAPPFFLFQPRLVVHSWQVSSLRYLGGHQSTVSVPVSVSVYACLKQGATLRLALQLVPTNTSVEVGPEVPLELPSLEAIGIGITTYPFSLTSP